MLLEHEEDSKPCLDGRRGGEACSHQTFQEVVKMSSAFGRVRTIARELVEFVRDWRTILAILVIPLLLFPILFILFPLLLASEAAELNAINVDVVVQADDVPDDLESMLDNASLNLTYEPLPEVENSPHRWARTTGFATDRLMRCFD